MNCWRLVCCSHSREAHQQVRTAELYTAPSDQNSSSMMAVAAAGSHPGGSNLQAYSAQRYTAVNFALLNVAMRNTKQRCLAVAWHRP